MHCATCMVLDARECAQRRDVDAHPPSQLGGIARPPGHYVPPPHDTTTTALATTSRESSTTYYSHDATYILHGSTRRPPRAAPTSEDESDLFGRTQGRRAPSAPRESVCLGHTHHFPFLGFPAGHPCAILAPWADRPVLSFSQLSRLQQRLGIGAEIGSVALDWLSLLLCCFIYVAVWHESSGPFSRRATAPRIRAVLSAVGCGLAPLAPRKVRTVDERGEGQWWVDVSV